jgi:phage protein D
MPEAFVNARPRFRINGLDELLMAEAVKDVVIQQPLNGRAHAELRMINWGRRESAVDPGFILQHIRHGAEIEIMIGEENQQALFAGDITAIEERYGDGAPQLLLLAEDKMHLLARHRYSRSFADQSLDQVIQALADDAGLSADVQVDSGNGNWHQLNESNLAFMQRLLAPYDIAVRFENGTLRVKAEQTDANPSTISPQDGTEYLRIIADLNGQPTNSKVSAYNLASDEEVSSQSQSLSNPPSGTTSADLLAELSWPGEAYFPKPYAQKQQEAEHWAGALFRQRAKAFLHGDAVCVGIPDCRPGREVELTDVSERLRGRYQIVHCSHRFDSANGYRTHLKLNRPDWSE